MLRLTLLTRVIPVSSFLLLGLRCLVAHLLYFLLVVESVGDVKSDLIVVLSGARVACGGFLLAFVKGSHLIQ